MPLSERWSRGVQTRVQSSSYDQAALEQFLATMRQRGRPANLDELRRAVGDNMPSDTTTAKAVKPEKDKQLLKDLEADLIDVLFHLFKGQPRISGVNHFQYETFQSGRRHYERDNALFNGQYRLYSEGYCIAFITCKPHRSVTLTNDIPKKGLQRLTQGMLRRVINDYFQGAKLEEA